MRPERMTSPDRAAEILRRGTYGVLSMADQNQPYGIPINYVWDEDQNVLYFHGALNGKKVRVLAQNLNVSFCVVENPVIMPLKNTTYYSSVIVSGTCHIVMDEQEKYNALDLLCVMLCPDNPDPIPEMGKLSFVNIFRLDINTLEGKENRG